MIFDLAPMLLAASLNAQQMPPKKVKQKRVDTPVVTTPQTGNEQCVEGKVRWRDGTMSECKVLVNGGVK